MTVTPDQFTWLHERAAERRAMWTEHANSTRWMAPYIGIPFVEQGSSPDGCNCWGLVRLVLAIEKGIDVPAHGELSAADLLRAARAMREASEVHPWSKVASNPGPFDVVLMYARSGPHRVTGHAGIMTDTRHVLHVEQATHSVNVPLDHPRIRHRIIGFYRHASLLEQVAT